MGGGLSILQIEGFVPVRIQSPLADGGCFCLFTVDGRNGKGVRETCVSVSWMSKARGSLDKVGAYGIHPACRVHQRR